MPHETRREGVGIKGGIERLGTQLGEERLWIFDEANLAEVSRVREFEGMAIIEVEGQAEGG